MTSSRRCRPRGATLIEALCGLAILGSTLAAVLIVHGRSGEQLRRAADRKEACRAADSLLAGWWSEPERMPRNGSGEVPGRPGWRWRTRTRPCGATGAGPADRDVLVVEIRPANAGPQDPPTASVEVLIDPEDGTDDRSATHGD